MGGQYNVHIIVIACMQIVIAHVTVIDAPQRNRREGKGNVVLQWCPTIGWESDHVNMFAAETVLNIAVDVFLQRYNST